MIILKKSVPGLTKAALSRFTARAAAASGVHGEVNVLITGNLEIQSLNRRFRGKDVATDVLSFPADSSMAKTWAGDIAISSQIAAVNGRELGHSAGEEIKILILHGLLHLAGYDHERDHGVMAGKEARLRRLLKLPVGLIERQNLNKRSSRARGRQ